MIEITTAASAVIICIATPMALCNSSGQGILKKVHTTDAATKSSRTTLKSQKRLLFDSRMGFDLRLHMLSFPPGCLLLAFALHWRPLCDSRGCP